MLWDILTVKNEDGSFTVVIRFAGVIMIIFTVPIKVGMPLTIKYKNGLLGGKVCMVECDVHKTFTENIPMWAFRTTYPKDQDYIIFRIYNEVHVKFTCKLFNDGHLTVSCPSKVRNIPLDEHGNPIKEQTPPKPRIIEIPRQEEKFAAYQEVIESAKEEIKVRRNSA